MSVRVAVVGLGSVGSMALWRLARLPGVEAIGIEQFGVGHGHGSSAGESRLFRTAYHEGADYVPLLRRARELWRELGAASGRELLLGTGVLTVDRGDSPALAGVLDSVERHGLPHERFDAAALRRRFPQFDVRDDECGVLDVDGGALRPELGVLSAIERAVEAGATIHEHAQVEGIESCGDGVRVRTSRGVVEADRVVVAAGTWAPVVLPGLREAVRGRKLVLTWFVPTDARAFDPTTCPGFIRDRDGFHVFGVPMLDGYSVKISGSDRWGDVGCDRPEQMDLRLDPTELGAFGEAAAELFPGVHPEPVRYSVHHDGYTADRTPIVDRTADGRAVVVAGLSGHGFKLAPALGELAAQLASDGVAPLHAARFTLGSRPRAAA